MDRQTVDSSNLKSIGYDPEMQILEVEFQSGAVYQYMDVPTHVYDSLMAASSHGQYFSANIRNNYAYSKL